MSCKSYLEPSFNAAHSLGPNNIINFKPGTFGKIDHLVLTNLMWRNGQAAAIFDADLQEATVNRFTPYNPTYNTAAFDILTSFISVS